MTDAARLAREVIAVLDLQQSYFKTRDTTVLRECRAAEGRLRRLCQEALNPPAPPAPGLFDADTQEGD